MIPILYDKSETTFSTMGIGALADAISCTVTEERNGIFELSMTYPADGLRFSDLVYDNIILAPTNDQSNKNKWQPFRIYSIKQSMAGKVKVLAEHISYQLKDSTCAPFSATGIGSALNGLKTNGFGTSRFSFWTDIVSNSRYSQNIPLATRDCIIGAEGSIIDTYGGELEWDRYTVKIHEKRGKDNGVVVSYGKNLVTMEQEKNISTALTGIYPYYYSDGTLVQLPEKVLQVSNHQFSYPHIKPVDLTDKFEDTVPTTEALRNEAKRYITRNALTRPKVSITASFAPLWQTMEYKDLAALEAVSLCDYVTVRYQKLDIDVKAEVVKTVFNVLSERYDSISLGDAKQGIDTTVAKLVSMAGV